MLTLDLGGDPPGPEVLGPFALPSVDPLDVPEVADPPAGADFSGGVTSAVPGRPLLTLSLLVALSSPVKESFRMDGGVKMTELSSAPMRLLLGVSVKTRIRLTPN